MRTSLHKGPVDNGQSLYDGRVYTKDEWTMDKVYMMDVSTQRMSGQWTKSI